MATALIRNHSNDIVSPIVKFSTHLLLVVGRPGELVLFIEKKGPNLGHSVLPVGSWTSLQTQHWNCKATLGKWWPLPKRWSWWLGKGLYYRFDLLMSFPGTCQQSCSPSPHGSHNWLFLHWILICWQVIPWGFWERGPESHSGDCHVLRLTISPGPLFFSVTLTIVCFH